MIQTRSVKECIEYINQTVREVLPNKDADTIRILESVLEVNETGVLQSLNTKLTLKQTRKLERIIQELQAEKPLEYITGIADFHGRKFYVSRNTLIPRVETETLVDLVVGFATEKSLNNKDKKTLSLIDVGTGTGCIIISTALCLRDDKVRFFATDISDKALTVAKKNIRTYSLGRSIKVLHGNLLEPGGDEEKYDIIAANLPYIRHVEMTELDQSVKGYEPHIALDGGENGATLIKELLVQSIDRLAPKGVIVLEIQPVIIDTVMTFVKRFYPHARNSILPDTFGKNRFITIET